MQWAVGSGDVRLQRETSEAAKGGNKQEDWEEDWEDKVRCTMK
jgi:hypothetical protein